MVNSPYVSSFVVVTIDTGSWKSTFWRPIIPIHYPEENSTAYLHFANERVKTPIASMQF
jgi:hypothetical protein